MLQNKRQYNIIFIDIALDIDIDIDIDIVSIAKMYAIALPKCMRLHCVLLTG